MLLDISLNWGWTAALLLLTGFATGYIREFSEEALITWLWVAPTAEFGMHLVLRGAAPWLVRLQGPTQRAIIVGMNEQGAALAQRIHGAPYSRVELLGFVDSRETSRLGPMGKNKLLGKLDNLACLVQENHVQLIYLSLPMASQPRILQLFGFGDG